jgi:hypothetical protein
MGKETRETLLTTNSCFASYLPKFIIHISGPISSTRIGQDRIFADHEMERLSWPHASPCATRPQWNYIKDKFAPAKSADECSMNVVNPEVPEYALHLSRCCTTGCAWPSNYSVGSFGSRIWSPSTYSTKNLKRSLVDLAHPQKWNSFTVVSWFINIYKPQTIINPSSILAMNQLIYLGWPT